MGVFEKQVEYFGIDIGSGGVRVVQTRRGGQSPSLVTYGHVVTPPGLTISDAPADITQVAAVVRQLVKDARISTKYVVAGVPSSKVFASIIKTPILPSAELGRAIALQADQYIPMALKDVKLDWFVLGPSKANPKEQDVLLVAAPNTITEKYLSICAQAGLELVALEPNAIALTRAIVPANDLAVVTLDIGSVNTDITIVQSNLPRLLRSINIGGTTFVKEVAQNLRLDDAQAEQFTRKFGLTQTKLEGQVLKALKGSLDQLTSEIDKSIKFFISQNPEAKIEKIVLTGGTVALPELNTYLSTATGLPVEIANAWLKVGYPGNQQDQLMSLSTEYGVAAGLSIRDSIL